MEYTTNFTASSNVTLNGIGIRAGLKEYVHMYIDISLKVAFNAYTSYHIGTVNVGGKFRPFTNDIELITSASVDGENYLHNCFITLKTNGQVYFNNRSGVLNSGSRIYIRAII